jgi:hypothetical protein
VRKEVLDVEAKPLRPQVDEAEFEGRLIRVGDKVTMDLPGQRNICVVKIMRIDLEEAEGAIRDVTVALWSKKSGADHPQHGMTRTISPKTLIQYL